MNKDAGDFLLLALNSALKAGEAIMQVYERRNFNTILKADKSPLTEADRIAHRLISDDLKTTGIPVLSEEGREIPWKERRRWKSFWLVDPLDGTKEFIKRNGEFTVNIALISGKNPVLGIIYAPDDDLMYAAETTLGAWRIRNCSKRNIRSFSELPGSAETLPLTGQRDIFSIVASRSHRNEETEVFIRSMRSLHPRLEVVSRGSALKFCMLAEGYADIYPRFGPTWEWDTGAGQAIAETAGCSVRVYEDRKKLVYNKEVLLNPWFIVRRD